LELAVLGKRGGAGGGVVCVVLGWIWMVVGGIGEVFLRKEE